MLKRLGLEKTKTYAKSITKEIMQMTEQNLIPFFMICTVCFSKFLKIFKNLLIICITKLIVTCFFRESNGNIIQ